MLYYNTPITYTINDVVNKNQQFVCDFINLKKDGFLAYTRSVNAYTNFFWSPWLKEADTLVVNFADNLKLCVKFK